MNEILRKNLQFYKLNQLYLFDIKHDGLYKKYLQ